MEIALGPWEGNRSNPKRLQVVTGAAETKRCDSCISRRRRSSRLAFSLSVPRPASRLMAAPSITAAERIGDLLVREGLITKEQLAKALQEQKQSGTRVGYNLVKLGFIQEIELTKMLAKQHKMPAVDLSRFEVDPKIAKMIPNELATEASRPAAQARRPHADRRDGRSDEPRRPRGPQVHHALRHLPGHRRRVHAARL